MRLLVWNIQHGGGTRLDRIVEEIPAYDPDVIAVTEYRARPGERLTKELAERGWPNVETTRPAENQNGIAVFARTPLRPLGPSAAPADCVVRWLDVELPEYGFGLAVLHVMAAGSSRKHPLNVAKVRFWEAVLRMAEARVGEPFLLAGDWNTGAHGLDESGKTFVCAEHFGRLSAMGWTDLWRQHNPGRTEHTWYSKLKGGERGNGFRLDHAFATPALAARVTSCRYLHGQREAGVSDHSLVMVDVE